MSASYSFYDFHGLVGMQVIDHERSGLPGLDDPFSYFHVGSLPDIPDVTLELGSFEPQFADCYLVDHKYHVRHNYLYCEDTWRRFRWRVEIEGFESGPTHIRLDLRGGGLRGVILPGMYSKMLLTRQLLAHKLSEKGCALAHAAGAARNRRAVVLFGRGGSYKTSVLMSLLRSSPEWRALGDDGVILKGGQAWSFPTFPAIFRYRLSHKDNEALTVLDRLKMAMNPAGDDAARVCYASGAEIAALVEMRAGGVDKLTIEEVSAAQNVAAMYTGMRLEQHNSVNMGFNDVYPQYLEAYAYIFPQNELKTGEEGNPVLSVAASCRVSLPLSPGRDDLQSVSDFLNEINDL